MRVPDPPTPGSDAQKESREPSHRSSTDHHDGNSTYSSDDNDDCSLQAALLVGAGMVVSSPIWVPRSLIGDAGEPGYFPAFPYVYDLPGYMMIVPEVPFEQCPWSLRLRSEYADSFDEMSLIGGHLLLETTSRFGFDAEENYRREDMGTGRHDSLRTGDINALYRFAQSERWQFRAGAGLNWMLDSSRGDFGYNLTYGSDWFPRRPWVASSEIDWGEIGHAHLIHMRATVGIQIHIVEAYSGYDYYDLGREHLQGLVAGLRFWF